MCMCLQVPFTLSCGTPGRLRWVTTNIARFDPSVEWPSDLNCKFEWNKALKSYDGEAQNHLQQRGSRHAVSLCSVYLSNSMHAHLLEHEAQSRVCHALRLFCLCAPCAGAPLQLGDLQPSVQLQTQPLTMTVQQVQSETAMEATGGQWSALLGSPDDRLPELPPDGKRLRRVCNLRLLASGRSELVPSMPVCRQWFCVLRKLRMLPWPLHMLPLPCLFAC